MIHSPYPNTSLIIVGGGIFGAAVAYYFKRENPYKKVVVYERNELCSGNTSLAAALLTRVRTNVRMIPLSLETYRVIPEIEKITGDKIPVSYSGALHLAVNQAYSDALDQMLLGAGSYGIHGEFISADEAQQMAPWLEAGQANRIAYVPGEAYTDPYLLGMAFANAAKALGAVFVRDTKVFEILKTGNTARGVITKNGTHSADTIVLAAGVWSTLLACKTGVNLPMAAVRSQYWITEPSESLFQKESPTVIIPEANFYARPQGTSLLFGIRESQSVYAGPDQLPSDVLSYSYSPDRGWHDLEAGYQKLISFFPAFVTIGIKNHVAGFSAYTPDNQFILGEVPGIEGLLLATGCAGAGISVAGGVGLGISRLASGQSNPFDFSPFRVDRFGTIDPFSSELQQLCANARSSKTSG